MTDTSTDTTPPTEPTQEAANAPETPPPATEPESAGHAAGTPENAGDEPLGDAGRKALQAERDAARKAQADAERFQQEAETAQSRLAELEAAEMRRSVAAERGLTPEQSALLQGDDAEAMAAHADALLEAFAPPKDDRPYVRRRPVERLRTGSGLDADAPSMSDIADRVTAG